MRRKTSSFKHLRERPNLIGETAGIIVVLFAGSLVTVARYGMLDASMPISIEVNVQDEAGPQ